VNASFHANQLTQITSIDVAMAYVIPDLIQAILFIRSTETLVHILPDLSIIAKENLEYMFRSNGQARINNLIEFSHSIMVGE